MNSSAKPVVRYGRKISQKLPRSVYDESRTDLVVANGRVVRDGNIIEASPKKKRRLEVASEDDEDELRLKPKPPKRSLSGSKPGIIDANLSSKESSRYSSPLSSPPPETPPRRVQTSPTSTKVPPLVSTSSLRISVKERDPRETLSKLEMAPSQSKSAKITSTVSSSRHFSLSSPIRSSETSLGGHLSDLIKNTNSSPSRQPPRGVAKRMLGRSKTEPSFTSPTATPSPRTLAAAHSLPSFGSPSKQRQSDQEQGESSASFNSARPQIIHQRTYANARSFLVPLSELPASARVGRLALDEVKHEETQQDELDEELRRESYADLQVRWGMEALEASEEAILKSVTEMRSKGESRRFLDEMGWLYEGLEEGNSLSVQRSSSIEILEKLSDMDFMHRAQAADFIDKTWDMMIQARGEGDRILDLSLVFFASLLRRDPLALHGLVDGSETALPLLSDAILIDEVEDPLLQASDQIRPKPSKSESIALSHLRATIVQANIVQPRSRLSTCVLASSALRVLRPRITEVDALVEKVLGSLAYHIRQLPESDFRSKFEHVDNCLSILDDVMTGKWPSLRGFSDICGKLAEDTIQTLVEGLLDLTLIACVLRENGEDTNVNAPLVLRILVNLTNDSRVWCKAVHRTRQPLLSVFKLLQWSYREYLPIPEEDKKLRLDQETRSHALDRLCLALGLLTNVVRGGARAADKIGELSLSLQCRPVGQCLRECDCPPTGAVSFIISLYQSHTLRAQENDSFEDSFLTGHLAVLIGLLCATNARNQRIFVEYFPDDKLDEMITLVTRFAQTYDRILDQLASEAQRKYNGSELTNNVAHEVVESLRRLRARLN